MMKMEKVEQCILSKIQELSVIEAPLTESKIKVACRLITKSACTYSKHIKTNLRIFMDFSAVFIDLPQ